MNMERIQETKLQSEVYAMYNKFVLVIFDIPLSFRFAGFSSSVDKYSYPCGAKILIEECNRLH